MPGVPLVLFAGISVRDYTAAMDWYVRFLGSEPTFVAHATEAVWELAENRLVYVNEDAARAGHSVLTYFVDDLDAAVDAVAERGIEPVARESYPGGVRKIVFRDPDGNEIGLGGGPD